MQSKLLQIISGEIVCSRNTVISFEREKIILTETDFFLRMITQIKLPRAERLESRTFNITLAISISTSFLLTLMDMYVFIGVNMSGAYYWMIQEGLRSRRG